MLIVKILDTDSGESRNWTYDLDWDGDYLWSEGNYSCDCNRGLFFAQAGAEESKPGPCGDSRYVILSITNDAGDILYAEEAAPAGELGPRD